MTLIFFLIGSDIKSLESSDSEYVDLLIQINLNFI
jgi:hypothetical protein